jgi:hypothetical protein
MGSVCPMADRIHVNVMLDIPETSVENVSCFTSRRLLNEIHLNKLFNSTLNCSFNFTIP